MPAPVTPSATVWLPTTALLAVAVTVMAVAPASAPALALTDSVTVGGLSLSVMTMFCDAGLPSAMPADGETRVSVAVSVGSGSASSCTVKLTEPLVWPAGMVMVLPDSA